jgi:hypothetical protein
MMAMAMANLANGQSTFKTKPRGCVVVVNQNQTARAATSYELLY